MRFNGNKQVGYKMIKQEMMKIVYSQLAIDYNCKPEDFDKKGATICVIYVKLLKNH